MKRLLWLLALLALRGCDPGFSPMYAQTPVPPPPMGKTYVASQFGSWLLYAYQGNVATGSSTIFVNGYNSMGPNIPAFIPGLPITIDRGTGTAESLSISSVQICNSGTSNCVTSQICSPGSQLCAVNGTFSYAHGRLATLNSATYGLQEAINTALSEAGGTVLVDQTWSGPSGSSLITAAVGSTAVVIQDNRSGTPVNYQWNGSVYVEQGSSGTGAVNSGAAYQVGAYPAAGTTIGGAPNLYAIAPSMTQSQINTLFAGLSGSNNVIIPAGTPQATYNYNSQIPIDFRLGANWFQMPGVACDAKQSALTVQITQGSNQTYTGLFSASDIGKTFFFFQVSNLAYGSTASVWTPTLSSINYPYAIWSSNAPFSANTFVYYGTDNLAAIETAMTQANYAFPLTIPSGCLMLVNGTIPWSNDQVIVGRTSGSGGFVGRPGADVISSVDTSGNTVSGAGTGLKGFMILNAIEVDWTQGYDLYSSSGSETVVPPVYRPAYDHTSLANDPLAPGWITGGKNGVAAVTQNSAVICTPNAMAPPAVGQAIMFPYFTTIFTSTVSSTAGSCSSGFTARTMAAALPNSSGYTVTQAEWFTGSAIQSTTTSIPTSISYPLTLTLTLPTEFVPGWISNFSQHGHIKVCGIEMDYMGGSNASPYTLVARRGPATSAGCSGTTPIAPMNPCPAKNLFGSTSDQPWPVIPSINSGDSTPSGANWFPGECIGNAAIAFPTANGNTYVGAGLTGGFLSDLNLEGTQGNVTGNSNNAAGVYMAGNNAPFSTYIENIIGQNLTYDFTEGPASAGQHGVAAVGPTGIGNHLKNLWFFGAFPLAFVDFQGSDVTSLNMNSTEISPYDGTAVGSATCLQIGFTLDEQTGSGVTISNFDNFDSYACEPENGSHIEIPAAVDIQGYNISFNTANFEGVPSIFGGSNLSMRNSQLSFPAIDYGINNDFGTVNGTTLAYSSNTWDGRTQFFEWGAGGRCQIAQGPGAPVACAGSLVQGYAGRSISSSVTGTKEVNPEGGKITPGEWNTDGQFDANPMAIANVVDTTEPFWGRYAGCNLGSGALCSIEEFEGFNGFIYIGQNQRIADQPYVLQMDLESAGGAGQVTVTVAAQDSGSGQCSSTGTVGTGTFTTATTWNAASQPFTMPVDFTGHAGCVLQVNLGSGSTSDLYRVGYFNFVPAPSSVQGPTTAPTHGAACLRGSSWLGAFSGYAYFCDNATLTVKEVPIS